MRRCIGSPCRAYLVLRSCDVSPAASPAISSGRGGGFRVPVPVTGAAGGGKFENFLQNVIFFKTNFTYALSCPLCAF
ncbi:unnamed protein product [Staurois parvus]|uniref:Uncharacterized protein n=1 Tax=Staurois parvus TaxID=386267 RepID=A0ABN9GHC8_9NEOB|nr:unnamed protein product [Staurois parvus]